jgi:hypothetical protein
VGAITIMESPGGASVELIEAKQFPTGLYHNHRRRPPLLQAAG